MRPVRVISLAACFALSALPGVPLRAADFIRGDVNGDGRVTISDAHRFRMWVFDGHELECLDAADVNDDGRLDERDWIHIVFHLESESRGGGGRSEIGIPPMPPPFPAPGPDVTDDLDPVLHCNAYGGGEALEDPAAELKVLDAVAPGGGDDRAFIKIALASSVPIAARSGQIRFPDPIVREIGGWSTGRGFPSGQDRFWFGLTHYDRVEPIPPGEDFTAVEILVHLKEGVPAGEYPIVLESGELTDTETGRAIVPRLTDGTLVVRETIASVPLGTADFIRGDINGDGRVTISDMYRFSMWFRGDYYPPQCLDAADVNDDGRFDGSNDMIHLLRAQYMGGPPIPSPFPLPGHDPTDDLDSNIDCKSYGGGEVIEAPETELKVLDLTARGGDSSDLILRVALTSSVSVGAISGEIRFLAPIVWGVTSGRDGGYSTGGNIFVKRIGEESFGFGYMKPGGGVFPAGQDVQVLDFKLCLNDGVPAGEYAMLLESVELTEAQTGKAVLPRATGGTLVLENTVTGADLYECKSSRPPGQPRPEDVSAGFSLGSATVPPGGSFTVPLSIHADAPIDGYSFSIDFDEEVLQVLSAEYIWLAPAGTGYLVEFLEFNNQNDHPGNAGVDEGFVVGASVFRVSPDQQTTMPAGADHRVVEIRFLVRPDASETTTMIRFLDGGRRASGIGVFNVLSAYGFSVTPQIANSFAFLNGRVTVVADVATFVRGDSNGDGVLDLADPVATLTFLYLGGPRPSCYDAADANDDARLDVTDPIATLGFLFLDAGSMPEPYPQAGEDPTDDSMGCLFIQ